MYRRVIAVAFASTLSIIAASYALAFGRGGGHGGGGRGVGGHVVGGSHVGRGSHFAGHSAGRLHGGGARGGSLGGVRGGLASGFRPLPHSLQGARFLNKHLDHQRNFQNKILIYGGYDNNCYPEWNGYAWESSCGFRYDF